MTVSIGKASQEELRRIWTGITALPVDQAKVVREEALWEYWRRVAVGEEAFHDSELAQAFATGIRGIGNVVGELARQGRVPLEILERFRTLLTQLDSNAAAWAIVQLDAREALEALEAGTRVDRGVHIEALLTKGASWAAIAAMPYLSEDECEYLIAMAERRKIFTRAQRNDLRT